MKGNAYLLSLILLLVPLAGCAGSDGEVNVDLTTEEIQELIDDNIDDFLNNTSITVNQENNNTTNTQTIVNHYNTTILQSSSLKSITGEKSGLGFFDDYPVGLALIVRGDRYAYGTGSLDQLNGANICVGIGTNAESDLVSRFNDMNIGFTSVPIADGSEGIQKFRDGECDALTITSLVLAEDKASQLNNDTTWTDRPTEGIWIVPLFEGNGEAPAYAENMLSLQINQSRDEEIVGIYSLFAQINLTFECRENSDNCTDFSFTYGIDWSESSMISVCSHNLTFLWEASYASGSSLYLPIDFPGIGFDCVHTLNLVASTMLQTPGYSHETHTVAWANWVYSLVWETYPIETQN